MTSVTVQLSDREIKALKARTGKKNTEAALKAWAARANTEHTVAELRAALKEWNKQPRPKASEKPGRSARD
jgi:hypothetical protein